MADVLPDDLLADIEALFLAEGAAVAGSKAKQRVVTTDTLRLLIMNALGDDIHVGISDDSLQVLKAGAQNITGNKAFDGGASVGTSFTANVIANMKGLHLSNRLDQASNGGTDEGSAPNIDASEYSMIRFPIGGGRYFNIDTDSRVGKILFLENFDSTDSKIIGTNASFAGPVLEVPPLGGTMIFSNGSQWVKVPVNYSKGSFLGNYTGFDATKQSLVSWNRSSNIVTLRFDDLFGTSDANTMTLDNFPSIIQPTAGQTQPILLRDGGNEIPGYVEVRTNGILEFKLLSGGSLLSNAFTASGNKGIPDRTSITYIMSG